MRFTWDQHQQAARTISAVRQQNSGTALALMGIALLLLLQDLEDAS
jgi:ABC-type branched-subunit amino acid transport system ATPase component